MVTIADLVGPGWAARAGAFGHALPRAARAHRRGPRQSRAAAREGTRPREAHGPQADPDRQRGVRPAERVARVNHDATRARPDRGPDDDPLPSAPNREWSGASGSATRAWPTSSTRAGQELFSYVDDEGRVVDVGTADVNAYLRAVTHAVFTAKDFRTWGAPGSPRRPCSPSARRAHPTPDGRSCRPSTPRRRD